MMSREKRTLYISPTPVWTRLNVSKNRVTYASNPWSLTVCALGAIEKAQI